MITSNNSARDSVKIRRKRAVRPILDGLEDRLLMYTPTGDHFAYSSRITWSIMPDGTNLGGTTSNLVSTLDKEIGPGVWEQALSDAFAQWESVANVNVTQVGDNGASFNSGNIQQNSPNFGDIRIGGFAQAPNVLAFTMMPPPSNGGSDAGDIFFNTAQSFHINSDYDFETVAVHEIGHAVAGLGESTDPRASEYLFYNGIKQSLATDDVQGIQALWGPRAEDPIEQGTHNLTSANAAPTNAALNTNTNQIVLPGLNVASPSEQYWFKVTTPANASNVFTAQVQSSNLSELSPRVVIYNANLQGLTQSVAPANAYGATISASITNATPNTTYYVKVLGSNSGVSGDGAYDLTLNMGNQAIAFLPPLDTTVYAQPDQGGQGLFQSSSKDSKNDKFKSNQAEDAILDTLFDTKKHGNDSDAANSASGQTTTINPQASDASIPLVLSLLESMPNPGSSSNVKAKDSSIAGVSLSDLDNYLATIDDSSDPVLAILIDAIEDKIDNS